MLLYFLCNSFINSKLNQCRDTYFTMASTVFLAQDRKQRNDVTKTNSHELLPYFDGESGA